MLCKTSDVLNFDRPVIVLTINQHLPLFLHALLNKVWSMVFNRDYKDINDLWPTRLRIANKND